MSSYRIFETEGFLDDLREFQGSPWERVHDRIKEHVYPQLRSQPYFGKNIKKLRDYSPDTWRYRLGDLRLFYQIDGRGRIVIMAAAYLRRDAYKK